MALSTGVALGEDIAGFTCKQQKVLIVDAENGEYEIHRRVKSLGLPSRGVTVVEADGFHLGRELGELEALLEREQPGLVILDSFRSLWPGGDENDSCAVAGVLDPLRNLLRRLGPAGILLHHVSRAGNDYRGNSAIGAARSSSVSGFPVTRTIPRLAIGATCAALSAGQHPSLRTVGCVSISSAARSS